jgi:hypothetical protein
MSKQTQAEHAIRTIRNAKLSVSGNVIQFTFPDNSITSILIEDGERDVRSKEYFEQALKWVDKLTTQGMMTEEECRVVEGRIISQYKQIDK